MGYAPGVCWKVLRTKFEKQYDQYDSEWESSPKFQGENHHDFFQPAPTRWTPTIVLNGMKQPL